MAVRNPLLTHWLKLDDRLAPAVTPLTTADMSRLGLSALGTSQFLSASSDGQLIAFQSDAPDLVTNDFNNLSDVFVYHRATGRVELASVNATGANSGNTAAKNPQISPDGRYVLFESAATDLGPSVPALTSQLYARDLQTGTTVLVSANTAGQASARTSTGASWSADSNRVVFQSDWGGFVANDIGGNTDIFLRDLTTKTTIRVSEAKDGSEAIPGASFFGDLSRNAQISDNGRFVVFESFAKNLGPTDSNTFADIYIKDLQTGAVDLATIDTAGVSQASANAQIFGRAISADGRYVVYQAPGAALAPGANAIDQHTFLRDRVNGTTTLVSVTAGGAGRLGLSPVITADGRYVVFVSTAGDLDPTLTPFSGEYNLFRRDLSENTTRLVSIDQTGTKGGNGRSGFGAYPNTFTVVEPIISTDGRLILFHSDATDLTADANVANTRDLFLRDMQTGTTTLVSAGGNNSSYAPATNADLSVIAFETAATNLVTGDLNGRSDIVLRDLQSKAITLMSRRDPLLPESRTVGGTLVSATPDGRYVGFNAASSNDYLPGVTFKGGSSPYIRDTVTGAIIAVDLAPDGVTSLGGSNPILTPDGRFVAFTSGTPASGGPMLVPGITYVGPVGGFFSSDVYLRDLATGVTRIVSVDPTGTQSNNGRGVGEVAISTNGRFVVFTSTSSNLVAGLSNPSEFTAVYLRDTWTNTTTLVSHPLTGGAITGNSFNVSMSSDGRFVTFVSAAADLVAGDSNAVADVFQWDRLTGAVTVVSAALGTSVPGNGESGASTGNRPVVTPDGRFVAFGSQANNLTSVSDPGNGNDVFIRDMQTGITTLVSINAAGTKAANNTSNYPSISADGKRLVYLSTATDLAAPATAFPNNQQAYLRDLTSGVTSLVSITPSGTAPNGNVTISTGSAADEPTISPDGKRVAFRSAATNLVTGFVDNNGTRSDVYLRELDAGITRLVTANQSGTGGSASDGNGVRFRFTDNSRTQLFDSNAQDIIPGDRDGTSDVFAFTVGGTGTISGTLFRDTNKNGIRDPGESVLASRPIFLDANGNGRADSGETRLQTDAAGNYLFRDLGAGTYSVRSILDDGLTRTTPAFVTVTLATGATNVTGVDFGAVPADVDLIVTDVTPTESISSGRPFTVTWTVRNTGTSAAVGDWQDAVYLSDDGTLDGSDILLGTVPHTGGLAAAASYSKSATFATPDTLAGSYFVFVRTDRRSQVAADENRTNNLGRAFNPVAVTMPTLTLGATTADMFNAANQDRYFQITLAAGQAVRLTLDSAAAAGGTELYASFNRMPTPYEFDHAARIAGQPDQQLTIALTRPGTYYVLAHSRFGTASTSGFTITPTVATFGIESVGPAIGANNGRVTIEIHGTGFTSSTVPALVRNGSVLAAAAIDVRNPLLMYATFNLSGAALGSYDVRLTNAPQTSTLTAAFTVVAGSAVPNQLKFTLDNPSQVRAGRQGTIRIEYQNTGLTDLPASLFSLTAANALLRLPGDPSFDVRTVSALGIAPDGPAGILRPGQRGSVVIEFLSDGPVGTDILLDLVEADRSAAMDWVTGKAVLRPANIPLDAWDAVFANFLAEAGSTVAGYVDLLGRTASDLSAVGVVTPDVFRLLSAAIDAADAANTAASLAQATDADLVTPGFQLTLTRTHQQAIHGRYAVGPFGRGWSFDWDVKATMLTGGDVVVTSGAGRRFFAILPNGTYRSSSGDTGTLTLAGGLYTLTEIDGTIRRFRADGRLDFLADPNNNRVTAGYDANGRLTALTHTGGASIALVYNAQNRISQLTDSSGRTVTYTYDASGEHLTGYADQFGSHTYSYVTGQGSAREHALASVNYSDDTHVLFTYDARGRLIGEERDGGQVKLTYTYQPGGYTIIDAAGGTRTLLFDDHGQIVRTIDGLGRVENFTFDAAGNLTWTESPGGTINKYDYNTRGQLTGFTDAAGRVTSYTYDTRGNRTSYTDALGRTTHYSFDTANNLLGINYPDGTGDQFTHDAAGNTTSVLDRRGQVTAMQRDTAGQITKKTYADGTFITYTYDARGRLTTATDASGTTSLAYDGTDALAKVTYPDGKFLQFQVNIVGQRTKSTDQDGFVVNYIYDDLGRLDTLTDSAGGLIVDYTFDAVGRLIRQDNGNGTFTTTVYDAANQILSLTHFAPGGAINSKFSYTYDNLGQRTSVTLTDNDPATADGTTTYSYDAVGQLISVVLPGGRTIAYEYDAVGNRVSVTDNGVVTFYAVNSLNEYTKVGDTTYTYDASGNLFTKTDSSGTTAYIYDAKQRLVSVTGPGLTATYTYNALGHRTSGTVNGQTTSYLVDPEQLWSVAAEYDTGGAAIARYTYGIGLTSRVAANGTASYYDFDANSNTVGLTGTSGAYVNRYSYLPFGETTTHAASVANAYTFVGRLGVRTAAGGLFDLRVRSYDPVIGAFISADPIGLVAGDANFRRYVGNNPISNTDPLGLQSDTGSDDDIIPAVPPVCPVPPPNKPPSPVKDFFDIFWPIAKWIVHQWFGDTGNSSAGTPGSASGPGLPGGTGGPGCGDCDCPPGGPPGAPGTNGVQGKIHAVGSGDPNDIVGPEGFSNVRFLTPDRSLGYTIHFENVPTATAPAQEVFVTHTLDADLDAATFELGDIGFGDAVIDVPDGLQTYSTTVAYHNSDGSPLNVSVTANLDIATRTVTWTFISVDPKTGLLPEGVFDGFLPPNDSGGVGEAFINFIVRPLSTVTTNTTFNQQASIVFDTNAAILTNVFVNTIDRDAPTSSVSVLPATTTNANFAVTWGGSDAGSGIATYTVFVKVDSGPFTPWLTDTTLTTANYPGSAGHTYAFYSVATDNIGLVQAMPSAAQAQTQVVATPTVFVGEQEFAVGRDEGSTSTVTLYNQDRTVRYSITPYGKSFTGGIRTAAADFTGDGIADLVVASGPGRAGNVRIYDGVNQNVLFDFSPFGDAFTRGIVVSAGDLTADGKSELVITAESGGGARIRVFTLTVSGFVQMADFFGIIDGLGNADTTFRGGGRSTVGDVNGDGFGDLIFAAGAGGGPRIAIFSGKSLTANGGPKLRGDFFAFEPALRNGTYVTAVDMNGDGKAELIAGAGPGGGPRVTIFNGADLLNNQEIRLRDFFAGDVANRGGIRVSVKDLDNDSQGDLIVGAGPGGGSRITAYTGKVLMNLAQPIAPAFEFDAIPGFSGGVYVG